MKKNKYYFFRLIVSLLSILLTLGLVEIYLRTFGPKYNRFSDCSGEYYTNPRGYYDVIRKDENHTVYGLNLNFTKKGHGVYRIPYDYEQIKIPQKYVLGLGDSFTFGRGVRYEDLYFTRLERRLNRGQKKVEVKNYGSIGADIQDIFNIYIQESAILPQELLVIYGFVLNDFGLVKVSPIKGLDFIDLNNGGNEFNVFRKHSALFNFLIHCIEKRRLHTTTVKAYLDKFEGQNAENEFNVLSKLNQAVHNNNGVLLVVVFPLLYDFKNYRFESIHKKIKSFCGNNQILFLDLLPAFSQHKAEVLWANDTDHHPNEIAHRIAADEIYNYLKNNF